MRVDAPGISKITTAEALVRLSEAVSNQRPAADATTSSARLAAELKCAQAQSEGAEIELNRLKETELQKTQADIADLESAGKPVPTWMLKKCEKLTKALEAQWCQEGTTKKQSWLRALADVAQTFPAWLTRPQLTEN